MASRLRTLGTAAAVLLIASLGCTSTPRPISPPVSLPNPSPSVTPEFEFERVLEKGGSIFEAVLAVDVSAYPSIDRTGARRDYEELLERVRASAGKVATVDS